jgi:AsmA protein
MKKKLLIVIASLATVLAATVLIVVYKLNDLVQGFRPQIEQQLSVALGSKVELGEISASLFPTCHLSVHEVKVLAPDGKSASMSLGSLTASVALRPLLSKKLDISNLEIQRPRITLIKDASGTSIQGLNMSPSSTKPAQPSQSSELSGQPSSSPTQLDIAVSRVSVTDGELTIDDRVASKRTSVKDIDLMAGVEIDV